MAVADDRYVCFYLGRQRAGQPEMVAMYKIGLPTFDTIVDGPSKETLIVGDLLSPEVSEHPTRIGHHITHTHNCSRVAIGVEPYCRDSIRCYPLKADFFFVVDSADQVI